MTIRAFRPRGNPNSALRQDPVLSTRLFVPPARRGLIERPRLIDQLEEGLRCKLTLITAPAGFGKTTLLSAWRAAPRELRWPLAWVSLTSGDNDPRRFWSYVLAALEGVQPGAGEEALALLRPPEQLEMELVLTELINVLSMVEADFVLVLDDYHLIHAQEIHEAVGFLVEHMPPQMHLVIAGQVDPPLPLARLRVRGQLGEIHAGDLRFTCDEAATFLNRAMGLDLSAEDVAALEQRTEGWIAGLQLAALSLQGRDAVDEVLDSFSGNHRFVVEYLAAEVLQKQPPAVQEFLLQTSILDRFTAGLCDAVTEVGNGREMLERLERANLFVVPLGGEKRWYRYHHLFGDFLRDRLHAGPGTAADELHRRAAAWYEQEGLPSEAIGHRVAAGDFERAAALVAENARAMFMRGELATVLSWLDALPADMVAGRPELGLARAWAFTYECRTDEAERCLRDVVARLGLEDGSLVAAAAPGENVGVAGEISAIRARLAAYRGETSKVIELSHEALETLPPESAFLRSEIRLSLGAAYMDADDVEAAAGALEEAREVSLAIGNTRSAMFATRSLGALYTVRGALRRAAALYEETLARAGVSRNAPPPPIGIIHVGLSRVLNEWNELDAGVEHAERGLSLGKQGGDGKILIGAYVSLALLLQAAGREAEAMEAIEKVIRVSPGPFTHALRARLWLLQGNLREAAGWAQSSGYDPAAEPGYADEYEYLTLARVLLAQERTEEAEALFGKLLLRAERARRMGSALQIRAPLAAGLFAQGKTAEAAETLAPALALAQTEGYVRSFLDVGTSMIGLLKQIVDAPRRNGATSGYPTEYARRLLAALSPDPAAPAPARASSASSIENSGLLEPLSEREIAVLRLIAGGMSNQQIASELIVTVGTVKTHLKNIYGKLDVHSRTQALAKARALHLIY